MSSFEGGILMERTLEKMVRVLEKIERDLSGIKSELAQIRKEQKITVERGEQDETDWWNIRKERWSNYLPVMGKMAFVECGKT